MMKSAALAQTANKPDCFHQAIGYMQQRCTDLGRLEEDKISCKIHAGCTHAFRLMKDPVAISMTLCELDIAHLSPPMECRSVKQKATATPADRRHCVEWVLLLTYSHTILMTSILGPWPEVPSLGPATLGTLENQVSLDLLARATTLLTAHLARMCYAYQQLNDIGILMPFLREVA